MSELKRRYGVVVNYNTRAKIILEGFLKSEEGIKWRKDRDEELKDYILYGRPTEYHNEDLIDEIINFAKKDKSGK